MTVNGGRPPEAASNGRLAGWVALVLVLSSLNFLGNAEGDPPDDFVYLWSSAVLGLVQFGIMLAIILAIAGLRAPRQMLALRRPPSWPRALGLGVLVMLGVFVFVAALNPLLQPGEEQGLVPEGWDGDRAPQFFVNLVVIAGFVPVVEELMFRGVGYTLLSRFGAWAAIVLVGVGFALVHGIVEGLPVFFGFGAALAYLRYRTGSVYPCIAVHGLFNTLSLVAAIAS
jgi:uncharacterized protein